MPRDGACCRHSLLERPSGVWSPSTSVYAPAELERQVAAAGAVHLPFAAFQLRRPSEAVPLAEQIRQGARHFESPELAEELVDLLQRERVAVAVVDYLLAAAFTAAEAARHGINTANNHAGQTFFDRFGEVCTVV